MRVYLVFSLMFIAGLIFLIIQEAFPDSFYYPYLRQLTGVLLIGSTVSTLFKFFVDKESQKFILKTFKIHNSIEKIGLTEIVPNFEETRTKKYIEIINEGSHLYLVFNDGLRWFGNYSNYLEERFSRKTKTEIFITDRDGEFIKSLAKKTATSEVDLRKKLCDSIDLIKDLYAKSERNGRVKVYELKNYPTYTLIGSKKKMLISPYFIGTGRKIFPLFEFEYLERGSLVERLIQDIEDIRNESKLIWETGV